MAKIRHFIAQLAYVPRTLRLVWAAAPGWSLAWLLLLVVQGLLPAAIISLTRLLVDSMVGAISGGISWENIGPVLWPAGLIAGAMVLTQVLQSLAEWVRVAQSELIQDYLSNLIHEKSATVDLAYYESADYHDRLYQARNDLMHRPLALLASSGNVLQSSITLLAMATVLLPYGLWIPLLLVVSTLPAFYVVLRYNQRYHVWWKRTTADRRWGDYYSTMLTAAAVAAEIRLFDLGPYFQTAYRKLRLGLRTERLRLIKDQGLARLAAGVLATVISGLAMASMVWRAFLGAVTLGDLALFYQAFTRGQGLLGSLLGDLGQIYNNVLFLGNLFEFLELESAVGDPAEPAAVPTTLKEGVRFRGVTFRYPGSERAVFQDFDFVIPAGKIVALVGVNGVGKTTLVKLLCRFYDPEAGSVKFDGIDLRRFPVKSLRRMITGMFQFPVPYYTRVAENISLGDVTAQPGPQEIEAAARNAGAHEFITRLPEGYDTLLGKLFVGGAELSGGQWQRLALARAFIRRAPIMILDEPTSFMDSWSEVDWFDRLRVLARGQTALLITHRFTIARRADIIYVMEDGRVTEAGSHEELLALGGLYARSWAEQIETNPQPPDGNNRPLEAVLEQSQPEVLSPACEPAQSFSNGRVKP